MYWLADYWLFACRKYYRVITRQSLRKPVGAQFKIDLSVRASQELLPQISPVLSQQMSVLRDVREGEEQTNSIFSVRTTFVFDKVMLHII